MDSQHRIYLAEMAQKMRLNILEMIYRAKSQHIGSAFSCTEIVTALYFSVMEVDSKCPKWPVRDRFVLSKGHACTALYTALALRGFFPIEKLKEYGQTGTLIAGHSSLGSLPGIEVSAGSEGHGPSMAAGMALALKNQNLPSQVFVLTGDGELEEGSVWEAVMFANHHKLNNLTLIVDKNNLQIMGRPQEIINLTPLASKFKSFGWYTTEVDGHNLTELVDTLNEPVVSPKAIIANTVKGKGVSFMEDKAEWHGKCPNQEEYIRAKNEIRGVA